MISLDTDKKPFYSVPSVSKAHLMLCYRNFQAKNPAYSHVGLGVNCIHTAKVLREQQVRVDVSPVWDYNDVIKVITSNPTITHLVIEAPFLPNGQMAQIVNKYNNIEFACRAHSEIAFLQVEAGAISIIRDYIRLQDQSLNFKMSVNSDVLGISLGQVYNNNSLYLPNLYYTDIVRQKVWSPPGKLVKIGSFGAIRLMKNHTTAAMGALQLAAVYGKDLQFYLSVAREEQGIGVLQAIRNMFASVPFATLVEVPWSDWSDFRNIIASLDLHMQLSMSETFNITCADAACGGVPTVSSDAISWVPSDWHADIDDSSDVQKVGWKLLNDPHAAQRGIESLKSWNRMSLGKWLQWLSGDAKTMTSYFLR